MEDDGGDGTYGEEWNKANKVPGPIHVLPDCRERLEIVNLCMPAQHLLARLKPLHFVQRIY